MCIKKCGSNDFKFKLDKIEQSILAEMPFECQNGCEKTVKYKDYKNHLQMECEVAKFDIVVAPCELEYF